MTGPDTAPRPDPARRLDPRARGLWALRALGWAIPLVVAVPLLMTPGDWAPPWLLAVATFVVLLVAAVGVVVVPALRWRRWRWEVRTEEIDLRHGALTDVRTVVPMARVQHVDIRRSLLQQQTGTADLVIHTAAGHTTIPMLPEHAALDVRDRIAELARAPDEL